MICAMASLSIQKKIIGARENNSFDDREWLLDEIQLVFANSESITLSRRDILWVILQMQGPTFHRNVLCHHHLIYAQCVSTERYVLPESLSTHNVFRWNTAIYRLC
jgi:hypothetical protein